MRALIATDGTEQSLDAAHAAITLLHPGLEVEIVTVIPELEDPNDSAGGFEGPLITEEEAEEQHRQDEAQADVTLRTTLASLGTTATVTVAQGGHAGRVICDLAAQRGVDVLVVGGSDKGWFRRLVDGSVMEYAVHHAPCPVLVVRHPEE